MKGEILSIAAHTVGAMVALVAVTVGAGVCASLAGCDGGGYRPHEAEPGIEAGVSGAMAGYSGGYVVRAGGCNFPGENPTAADAQKRFYKGIYVFRADLDAADPSIQPVFELADSLELPTAYGSAVTLPPADQPTDSGVLVIGGLADGRPSGAVTLIAVADDKTVTQTPYPPLPFGLDNGAAALVGRRVYVAGGNHDGVPSREVWALCLDSLDGGWSRLPDMPGNARTQAVAFDIQGDLGVMSGFAPRYPGHDEPTLELDGLRYREADSAWTPLPVPSNLDGVTFALAGGTAITVPTGEILTLGGVNKDVFLGALRSQAPDYLDHPAEWYRFNQRHAILDPATGQWRVVANTDNTARAGASLVLVPDHTAYLLGGEVKPRVRTPNTVSINLTYNE